MSDSLGHVLIAPDKFKGSLTAREVSAHVVAGMHRVLPALETVTVPIADGGDGTVEAALAAGFQPVEVGVTGPTGEPVTARCALLGETVLVELAQASGLARLPGGTPAPLTASSYGTGELIAAGLRAGARRVILGLGGSACSDGGAGMVRALGARLLDADGGELPPGGAALRRLQRVDVSALRETLDGVEVVVASDVDNPLLGPHGAAVTYGPQKGASPGDVAVLEDGLGRWAEVTERDLGVPAAQQAGAGAAGGVGYAALAHLGAEIRSGVELLLDLLGFAEALTGARLVVTGEGSLDAQTLRGKGPAGVAAAAQGAGVPVVAVAGRNQLNTEELHQAGFAAAYALTDLEPDPDRCMSKAGPLLEQLAERFARDRSESPAPEESDEGAHP